ncbi:MAG: hydantoinase/oxoprolinase family protein, partial [Alphaproteobacteria bacterium]
FGGAGGLHAAAIAEALDIRRIVFPANASTLSARGILGADLRHDLARSRRLTANGDGADAAVAALRELAGDLAAEGEAALIRDGVPSGDRRLAFSADMRYRGQAYELVTPWPGVAGAAAIDAAALARLVKSFHAEHLRRFAQADPTDVVEIATLRLAAIGVMPDPDLAAADAALGDAPAPTGRRRVNLDGAWTDAPVYRREALGRGAGIDGPCIVEEAFTTLVIPGGWRARMAEGGDLVAERNTA